MAIKKTRQNHGAPLPSDPPHAAHSPPGYHSAHCPQPHRPPPDKKVNHLYAFGWVRYEDLQLCLVSIQMAVISIGFDAEQCDSECLRLGDL